MARQAKRLTARTVANLKKTGRHADGESLYLKVSKTGASVSKSWVFFYTRAGKHREAGLGSAKSISLAQAREKAADCRSLDAKKGAKEAADAAAARKTFGQCANDLIALKRPEWRSDRHAAQWPATIAGHCGLIRDLPIDEIDTAAVLSVLKPIWGTIPETAFRLRGRIEAVLDYAKAHKLRSGENPAAWRGHLALILPRRQKLSRGHHAAMAYREVSAFLGRLRENESVHGLALEFCILTAARLGEVLGARWSEIDSAAKVWTVPAARMKAAKEHRVPLSARAMQIIARTAAAGLPCEDRLSRFIQRHFKKVGTPSA